MNAIDDYIKQFPDPSRSLLRRLRSTIREAAPGAEERISYQMPGYFLEGRLVWFAAFKKHIGFYPTASGVAAFEAELAPYKHATGSIQFPLDQNLPFDLVARIVRFRVAENLAKAKATTKAKPGRSTKAGPKEP